MRKIHPHLSPPMKCARRSCFAHVVGKKPPGFSFFHLGDHEAQRKTKMGAAGPPSVSAIDTPCVAATANSASFSRSKPCGSKYLKYLRYDLGSYRLRQRNKDP